MRKRIRGESDEHIRDCFTRAVEERYRREMTRTKIVRKTFEGNTPLEALHSLRSTFSDDNIDPSKSFVVKKEYHTDVLDSFEHSPSTKTIRQIRQLLPYIDVKDEDHYFIELKNSVLASCFRREASRNRYNERLVKHHDQLLKRFDEDTSALIDETTQMRQDLAQNLIQVEDSLIQDSLRKWYSLKIDFTPENTGEGLVIDEKTQLIEEDMEKQIQRVMFPQFQEEVKGENVAPQNEGYEKGYELIKSRVFEQMRDISKDHFTIQEAIELLSDDSVMSLIENMRAALIQAHSLLRIELQAEEEKEVNKELEDLLTSMFYEQEKEIHLERIKASRYYDPSIRVRKQLQDENATNLQRLSRTLYENTKEKLFADREKHLKMASVKKRDFPHLENLPFTVSTKTVIESGLSFDTPESNYYNRIITINVPMENFEPDLKSAIETIFPNMIKKGDLIIEAKNSIYLEQNRKEAYNTLSKIIHESKMFVELGKPQNEAEYNKRKEDKERKGMTIGYKSKVPSAISDRLMMLRKEKAERNNESIIRLSSQISTALNSFT